MNKRLYTFIEFLNEGAVYEAKEPGYAPTEEQIMQILKLQQTIGENYKKKKPKNSDFKAYLDKNKGLSAAAGDQFLVKAYISLEVFNSISDASKKDAVIKGIQGAFAKRGIKEDEFVKAIGKLETLSKDKENIKFEIMIGEKKGQFKITITEQTESKEKPDEVTPPKDDTIYSYDIIDPAKASYFFNNNMYALDENDLGKTFKEPEYAKQVLDSIDDVIQSGFNLYSDKNRGNSKDTGIKSITIRTSCSRYRNTAPSEDLSWADLSYNRSNSFVNYIIESSKKISGGDDKFVKMIAGNLFIDYLGSNQDGTSGPDPDKDTAGNTVRKGHYIQGKGWVSRSSSTGNDLLKIEVVPVTVNEGQKSKPTLGTSFSVKTAKDVEGKDMTSLPAKPDDYDKFRYIYIEVETKKLDDLTPEFEPGEKEYGDTIEIKNYEIEIKFPAGKTGGNGGGGNRKRRTSRIRLRNKENRKVDNGVHTCGAYD
jgi:hypothetical protein